MESLVRPPVPPHPVSLLPQKLFFIKLSPSKDAWQLTAEMPSEGKERGKLQTDGSEMSRHLNDNQTLKVTTISDNRNSGSTWLPITVVVLRVLGN